MRRIVAASVVVLALAAFAVPAAHARVNVERQSSENPMVEIARSTFYGALAGTMVGGAIAVASESGGEPVKWGFVIGTFVGAAYGFYYVQSRPTAGLLEFQDGSLSSGGLAAIEAGPGQVRVRAITLSF